MLSPRRPPTTSRGHYEIPAPVTEANTRPRMSALAGTTRDKYFRAIDAQYHRVYHKLIELPTVHDGRSPSPASRSTRESGATVDYMAAGAYANQVGCKGVSW